MKILLLHAYFSPENTADLHLDCDRYEAFAKAGFSMLCFTPSPVRGVSNDVRKKYRKIKNETWYNGLLQIHRFKMIQESSHPFMRAFRYFLCCVKHFYYGVHDKSCDVMFVISTPPIQGLMAALVKKIRKIPIIYNLQDVFPDSLVASGLASQNGFLWKIGRKIENFTYKNSDVIIAVSNDIRDNIIKKGVQASKIKVINNWVDTISVHPVLISDNPLFDKFQLNTNNFYVVYAGNLGYAQNIDVILDAASILLSNKKIVFIIFGSGGIEDTIKGNIVKRGLSNVKLFPLQSYELVSCVYSIGNVCVVSCKKGFGRSAMPSKTWTIMSSGRPIIASFDDGELKQIIEGNRCGLFSQAEDVDGFVNSLLYMFNNPSLCEEFGRNARQYVVNNLSKDRCTSQYVDIVREFQK